MTTTFLLVRHAAHDNLDACLAGRMQGYPLGANGLAQARRLAGRICREQVDAIVASPRERTCETAAMIALECGIDTIETSPELDEIDFGQWSGKTFAELGEDPQWQRWNSERDIARTPGGETMRDVQDRIVACMDRIARGLPGRTAVLVSHADVIKAAVCHYLDMPVERCFRFDIEPASITTVVSGSWGAKLVRLNEVAA